MARSLAFITVVLLWVGSALGYNSGAGLVTAMKNGDFVVKYFDGTQAGIDSAVAYCALGGVVQLGPGLESLKPTGTLPTKVAVVRTGNAGFAVSGPGIMTGRLGTPSGPGTGGAFRIVDGVTFDTTGVGIQAAIDDLPAAGGTVYLPAGNYRATATIYTPCDRPVRIIGAGARISANAGTQIINETNGTDVLRLRGDFSSVSNLWINGGIGTTTNQEQGRGIALGRRNITDPHPPPGTSAQNEITFGGGGATLGQTLSDLIIYQSEGWGIFISGDSVLPDLVTVEAGALAGVSISIIVSLTNVRVQSPKKYGGIYIGADNNVIQMNNCTVAGVGAGKTGADAYYVWARFVYKFVMDQCVVEGLNPGTKSWVNLGAQGTTVKDGWFEEDGGDASTLPPTYFIEALGGTVGLDIDHPEFIRASATANGRPRLIKLNSNSHGVTITNPRAKMVDNLFGGGTWLETNHIDLGGSSNRSITVLGRGQVVDSVGTNYDIQYSNVPTSAAFISSASAMDTLSVNRMQLKPTTFANLGTPVNGFVIYCSDCTKTSPCMGGGTGALAFRRAGTWDCFP